MGKVVVALRTYAGDRVRDFADALENLEQLWAVAFVTAILTVLVGLVLELLSWQLPKVLEPAEGFAVAALVSLLGFWRIRARRGQRLLAVAGAARQLLDNQIGTGAGAFDALVHGPLYRGVTIRGLGRAHRQGRLADELGYARGLAEGIEAQRIDFQQATAHHAERLSPPRANLLVDRVIRSAPDAAEAASAFEREAMDGLIELRYEPEKRRALLATPVNSLGEKIERVLAAAEELEAMANRAAFRHAEAERDRRDAALRTTRLELQATAAAAGERILAIARPPTELDATLPRIATLRDLVNVPAHAFNPAIEAAALAAWRKSVAAAHDALVGVISGRGHDMHAWTSTAWQRVNDALSDLDRAITELQNGLETAPKLTPSELASGALARHTTERRDQVLAKAKAIVARTDEMQALQVR